MPALIFFFFLISGHAWQMLKSIHHRLVNCKPSPLALALSAIIPLAFATFIALQLLWAEPFTNEEIDVNKNTKIDWLSAKKPRITPISAPTKERKT